MMYRMTIALLALVNSLVAAYLHLWKTGRVGTLVCTADGGCETAQFSQYGWFLGVDVALIGAVFYAVLLVVALVSLQPRHVDARRMSTRCSPSWSRPSSSRSASSTASGWC